MYRFIDHTADTGIEIEADSVKELFKEAGEALCELVCERSSLNPVVRRQVEIRGNSWEGLLQGFLSELVYLFDVDYELYPRVEIERIEKAHLVATLWGEKIDPQRHEVKTGIKGVTFHQLGVWEEGGTWRARVIFDV